MLRFTREMADVNDITDTLWSFNPPQPAEAPTSPRPIRLQDIPMRIVNRRRRSTENFVSLSRAILPPRPACRPSLSAAAARYETFQPVASLLPAVNVEVLRQKADLAELEAKSQRSTTLKALEAKRRAERQTAELVVAKERLEQDLRQATIAHQRLTHVFQRVVETKRKVEAKLKNEQRQQQQKQEVEEDEKKQEQALRKRTTSANPTASAPPSRATTNDNDGDDQDAARAQDLPQGLHEILAQREADLMNLQVKLKRQGQARHTQLKEWEAELQDKEERVQRVAEKLRKQRRHLQVCHERSQRQSWEDKGRRCRAASKSPRRSLPSSPLRARRVRVAAGIQNQDNRNSAIETEEEKGEEKTKQREPEAAAAVVSVQWEGAPRCRHLPQYSTSSSAVDGKEEIDVALDSTILPLSVTQTVQGNRLVTQYERSRGGVGATTDEEMKEQKETRLFRNSEIMAAGPAIENWGHEEGSKGDHDCLEAAVFPSTVGSNTHIPVVQLAPPAIPQIPPSICGRIFRKEMATTLDKIQRAKLRVTETCAVVKTDGRTRTCSLPLPPPRVPLQVAVTTECKKMKDENELEPAGSKRIPRIGQGERLQWLSAFDGRLAKSMREFEKLKK